MNFSLLNQANIALRTIIFIGPGFSLGRLHMGRTSAGGYSVNGGTHEGGLMRGDS